MPMYVTFITLLENYEIAIHAHNYRFFWKELCFNYLISTLWIFQLYEDWAFFYLFWVSQYDPYQAPPRPPTPQYFHIGRRRANPILIYNS